MRTLRASGPDRDRLRPIRTLGLGLLLAGALLVNGFDLHPHTGYGAALESDAVPLFSGATHPDQPAHLETAGRILTIRCPACLLHLLSQGRFEDRGLPATIPSPAGTARADAGFRHAHPTLLAGGSRAPPLG